MIYGAILAGGVGKRVERYTIPKQFISIGGIPIIVRTLRTFVVNDRIDLIYVAVHKDWMEHAKELFRHSFSAAENARIRVVEGGKERLDSFTNIMEDIIRKTGKVNCEDILICHDSVRPFVRQQMINDCITATIQDGIALTVIPVADTIHVAHESEYIDAALDRSNLYQGQTPSGFKLSLLHDACSRFSEVEKSRVTGTTQLMLKLGYKIRIVKGHTSNFKITTDNDLDIADRMVRAQEKTRKIELLDCTLRDGGIVIDFNFGRERMNQIRECLEKAEAEYIECGYIDEKKGSKTERTCFFNENSIADQLLSSGKKEGCSYLAMIDYGTYDLKKLSPANEKSIDGIRFAFHKEHWKEAVIEAKEIIQKGYDLYIQPMVSMRYSEEEFRELIAFCCRELPEAKAFYIVDSFGQMDNMMLMNRLEIADQYVSPSMKLGFHAHNNRQMAFSNACALVQAPVKHDLILDSSIMGMGKGAGNLCTELIMPVLLSEGNVYQTQPVYEEITGYFSNIMKTNPWGYCLDYYLSSVYGCSPSYIKLFVQDERVTTDILVDLLENIPEEKKAACDRSFAAEYIKKYFGEMKS